MTHDLPRAPSGGAWFQRLGSPVFGNVCAALGLLVAVAAGVGLLRQGLFWLIFSYFTLVVALVSVAAIGRHRARVLHALDAQRARLGNDVVRLGNALARSDAKLTTAREDVEASEAGYASLRAAVIQTARWGGSENEDFDDELANALRKLAPQPDTVLPEPR